jgi:hypothetical protein
MATRDRFTLPEVDLVRHRRMRLLLKAHHNAVVDAAPRTAFRTIAKKFGLLDGDELMLETDGELIILFDYMIYSHRLRNGRTPVERHLSKLKPTDAPDEQVVRGAMAGASYSLHEVTRLVPPLGVHLQDVICGKRRFAVDESLSQSGALGMVMAGRLLPFGDYHAFSGGMFPLGDQAIADICDIFLPVINANARPGSAMLNPQEECDLAAAALAAGFADGSTSHVSFQ